MKKPFLTIFTPAYNRTRLLPRLYESLTAQTDFDFEWIIIDDGSTDDLATPIKKWQKANKKFAIVYKRQPNGGKHRAINNGLKLARGKMFFIVDNDDYLAPNAVTWIKSTEKSLPKTGFIGLAGLKVAPDQKHIGTTFAEHKFIDSTSINRQRHYISGDKSEVVYTNIFRRYLFPEVPNENFLTEGVVWNRIAHDGLKFRYFNEPIYIAAYQPDGLSRNHLAIMKKNPIGWGLFFREYFRYARPPLRERILKTSYYTTDILDGDIRQSSEALGVSKTFIRLTLLVRWLKRLPKKVVLATCYRLFSLFLPVHIHSTEWTLREIKKGRSLIRFGDGEISIASGGDIWFQQSDTQLQKAIGELIKNQYRQKTLSQNILLTVPRPLKSLHGLTPKAKDFWRNWLFSYHNQCANLLSARYQYGDTQVSRPYRDFKKQHHAVSVFGFYRKQIFKSKDILIIEGSNSRFGVGTNLLEGAKSVRRLIAPPANAWQKYNKILSAARSEIDTDDLVIVSLGPTTKPLIAELSLSNPKNQILDLGHLSLEYLAFLSQNKNLHDTISLQNTGVDKTYQKSIVKKV